MRVLINALQAANRSGTGRYTIELCRALGKLDCGADFTVLWPGDAPEAPPEGVEVLPRNDSGVRRLLLEHLGMERLRRHVGADLVHYPATIGPMGPVRNVVLTVHDLSFLHHPEWFRASRAWYYRATIRRSVRHATRILADSEATARDLVGLLGVPRDRIDVAHLGVSPTLQPDPESAATVRNAYHLPDRSLLYMGTLEPRKNLVRLVEAFGMVHGETPQDLVLAGRWGWRSDALKTAIKASPCRDRIHLPGHIVQADIPGLYSAADAFLWPSLFEGFGLPPLEAMACGTPVLTSNTSSLPEVVGDAALLVDPEDTTALADAICRLGGDESLRQEYAQAGRIRAKSFTWQACAEKTAASYRRALGR